MIRTIDAVSEFDQKINEKKLNRDGSDLAPARSEDSQTRFGNLECANERDQDRSVVIGLFLRRGDEYGDKDQPSEILELKDRNEPTIH